METDWNDLSLDDLHHSLTELDEKLQNVMSIILMTQAMIRDIENEKKEMENQNENRLLG